MTAFAGGAATDKGRVRSSNQDNALVADNLFAVADGMGGHQAGEVASQLAIASLRANFTEPTVDALMHAVEMANEAVYEQASEEAELRGMGTTLCALAPIEAEKDELVAVVNVGDSRAYLLTDGQLEQLTQDHSLVETMVRQGRLSPEEAAAHPQRNILTRALGIDPRVEIDMFEVLPYAGDRYLLCSDGLFNEVDESRIAATLRRLADPNEAARELVRLANEGGGRDNITCVVVDVTDDGGRAAKASAAVAGERVARVRRGAEPDLAGFDSPVADGGTGVMPAVDGLAGEDDTRRKDRPPTDEARHRRLTWRVGLFVLALLVVAGAAVGALAWYARNTYFVAFSGPDDEVVIFQGRPGGFLWFDPTLEERTGLHRADLPERDADDIAANKDQASLDDAQRYVENLGRNRVPGGASTTTTTTTGGSPPSTPP